jgi:hypothetical protein
VAKVGRVVVGSAGAVRVQEHAATTLTFAHAKWPADVLTKVEFASTLTTSGRVGEAAGILADAVREEPRCGIARRELGRALMLSTAADLDGARSLLDAALVELRHAVALSPGDAEAAWLLGGALCVCRPHHDPGALERALPGMLRHIGMHAPQAQKTMRLIYGKAAWTLCKWYRDRGDVGAPAFRVYFHAASRIARAASRDVRGNAELEAWCAELVFETAAFGHSFGLLAFEEAAAQTSEAVALLRASHHARARGKANVDPAHADGTVHAFEKN